MFLLGMCLQWFTSTAIWMERIAQLMAQRKVKVNYPKFKNGEVVVQNRKVAQTFGKVYQFYR